MQIVLDVSEFQSTSQLDSLLRNADDEIVGVYIKATQDVTYRNSVADAFAGVCRTHDTPFGYYDFLTNTTMSAQATYFSDFVRSLAHAPSLSPMVDAEGAYDLFATGVEAWAEQYGEKPVLYAQLSNMPHYANLALPKWVAQYDSMTYYRPKQSEIDSYRSQGYVLWQWTSNYAGLNQDASVLIGDLSTIHP
ncbi:MAG TPA: GH25 family lysozyme [Candidatus Baltobacteraceae bacterium]|nr:GH25 family lysozyme [Candidatus Baltobacteraceae bacterium]